MATVTLDNVGPGIAGSSVLRVNATRAMKVVTASVDFDSSYPTGGESISDVFDMFQEVKAVFVEFPSTTAATGQRASVDLTGKKLLLWTNASPPVQVTNASDQSLVVGVKIFAIGY